MKALPPSSTALQWMHSAGSRLGHDAIWLAIAVLFCVVELAVFITELNPTKRWRTRSAHAPVNATALPSARALSSGI